MWVLNLPVYRLPRRVKTPYFQDTYGLVAMNGLRPKR